MLLENENETIPMIEFDENAVGILNRVQSEDKQLGISERGCKVYIDDEIVQQENSATGEDELTKMMMIMNMKSLKNVPFLWRCSRYAGLMFTQNPTCSI